MRVLSIFVLNVFLLASITSCGSWPSADSVSEASSAPEKTEVQASQTKEDETTEAGTLSKPTEQTQAAAVTKTSSTAGAGTSTTVYSPEELLTAEEASAMVGQTVTLTSVSDEFSANGELSAFYTYDFPSGSTVFASLYFTQNALISDGELKKGHDAKWAFEESKKNIPIENMSIENIPNLGIEAFYNTNNMEVSVFYQDFYFLVVFVADNDDAATLALNRAIAVHILSKFILAPV